MSEMTFYFETIFPDYYSWKSVVEQTDIVNYEDTLESAFDEYCFRLLSFQFSHHNIRYGEPESFILRLLNIYRDKFKKFKKSKELVDKVYELTDDELLELNEILSNYANNPNDLPSDPKTPLNFISSQTLNFGKNNKLDSYLKAIDKMPTTKQFNFLNESDEYGMSFKELFMFVIPPEIDLYEV